MRDIHGTARRDRPAQTPGTGRRRVRRLADAPRWRRTMTRSLSASATIGVWLLAISATSGASAQQSGGILKVGHFTSPASMSMLEESTVAVNRPISGVFNNLVMFKQDEPQNTPESIVPELATEWRWSEDG